MALSFIKVGESSLNSLSEIINGKRLESVSIASTNGSWDSTSCSALGHVVDEVRLLAKDKVGVQDYSSWVILESLLLSLVL